MLQPFSSLLDVSRSFAGRMRDERHDCWTRKGPAWKTPLPDAVRATTAWFRPRILVFNYCYHGSVDETIVTTVDGVSGPRAGNVGPAVDPAQTTRVVEFNDVDALDEALSNLDVACVLAEPALTNIGIVLPGPGYHDALRAPRGSTGRTS